MSSVNHMFLENWDLMKDSNLFLAQLTILILVNYIPLVIEIWSCFEPSQPLGTQSTMRNWELIQNWFEPHHLFLILVNHTWLRLKIWSYFVPSQPFRSQRSCMRNQNLIISCAQSTILSSVNKYFTENLIIDSNLFSAQLTKFDTNQLRIRVLA